MTDHEFSLDHNSVAHICSFLSLNEASEAGLVSRVFHEQVTKSLRFESKSNDKIKFYNIKSRSKIKLILKKDCEDKDLLQELSDKYGSFEILNIEKNEYNLIKFNKKSVAIDDKRLKSFYKFVDQKYSFRWKINYLSYDEIFIDNGADLDFAISEYGNDVLTFSQIDKFQKDQKYYHLFYSDEGRYQRAKFVLVFNEKTFGIYYREYHSFGFGDIGDGKFIPEFYCINEEFFALTCNNGDILSNIDNFDKISENCYKYNDNIIYMDKKEIKIISNFESKYTIKKEHTGESREE